MAKLKSGTRIYGTATVDTSIAVGSAVTANSSGIQVAGIVTANQLDLTANATANDSVLYLSGAPLGTNSTNGIFGIGALNFTDTNIIANYTHNVNSYAQVVLQNKNSGSTASSDFVVNNDRTAGTVYYGDFGINATTYNVSGPFGDPDGPRQRQLLKAQSRIPLSRDRSPGREVRRREPEREDHSHGNRRRDRAASRGLHRSDAQGGR